ncbi:signal-transducing adaptor protein 2a isoform X2 [Ictalurus furcatus]|uniref:signal-transducing adaptor protein 2a isoform X2 n=1 Tax=Ictalurus furcatus TaxID=66913 RepID=UPI002350FAC4|nr:signal-transducing adaptor protein 2a isoform X2 [Ictalurus furcatus]
MATAMAAPVKQRTGTSRAQLPPCYYEGYLEKRGPKEKVSRRLWTCLCGNTLYFFNNAKDTHYVEKLDLSGFVSLIDDCSRDRNLEAARMNLRMKDGEIKLTAPNLEARELWKGFLYSVVDLAVPTTLTLLPGQLHMLKEVVEKERQRRRARSLSRAPSSPLSLPLVGEIPACFRPVSRTEAEVLLERHPDCGNMLLRPGRDGTSLAVTTRQDLNGSVFRHYRVTQKSQGGYIIDVENPIPCPTLYDVINALVEKTAGTLQPFLLEEPYEENITYISSNDENGERMLHCAPTGTFSRGPSLPPKGSERWTLRSHSKSPSPSQRSLSPPGSPSSPMRRLVLSPSPSPLAQTFTEELKQKLEKRRTSQD